MTDFHRLISFILIVFGISSILPSCVTTPPSQTPSGGSEVVIQGVSKKQIITEQNAHYEAARELIALMTGQMDVGALVNQLVEVQLQFKPTMRPYRHIFIDFIKERITSDEYLYGEAKIYMELLSENELRELKGLMETDVWKKYQRLMPQFIKGTHQLLFKLIQEHASEFQGRLKKEIERIQKLQEQNEQLDLTPQDQ